MIRKNFKKSDKIMIHIKITTFTTVPQGFKKRKQVLGLCFHQHNSERFLKSDKTMTNDLMS